MVTFFCKYNIPLHKNQYFKVIFCMTKNYITFHISFKVELNAFIYTLTKHDIFIEAALINN